MQKLALLFELRYSPLTLSALGFVVFAVLAAFFPGWWFLHLALAAVCLWLAFVGVNDLRQTRHAILRNYPIAGHLRFMLEGFRPEIRQYFFEGDKDGAPFPRDKRAIVYQRAKKDLDKRPFGTQYDVYADHYEWLHHSLMPQPMANEQAFRVLVGADCKQPYSASVLNISAMSYGALSANAVLALNKGAKLGAFAHDTGEGGVSPHHRTYGGDLIWEVGSGYFGCRKPDGTFDPEKFAAAAADPQIKMVELKLSQGAKPGHGGVLPAAKITSEISAIRGVPMGEDCISPARHSSFSTPIGLLQFVAQMRDLSGGKPAGFKLCIGHPWEFMAICKAMLETGITPDFIVIDGKEGGTGAAPLEFMDHVGMPLREGLSFAHNALVGIGMRDRIRLGASGKIVSAFDMARVMALGADWCNAARGFMFAVGCIQAQTCHTGLCPTGVTSQDPARQRAIVVPDKAERVFNFHHNTIHALAELVAAAGLDHPGQLEPHHFLRRADGDRVMSYTEQYEALAPGQLLAETGAPHRYADAWRVSQAHSFARNDAASANAELRAVAV
ncbi:MAG: FMN-binding glutamate synthase family protein [Cereibacter sphaeroides]|uniref:FMN-binding glutamate synthase family protein n=1 Tax=Cereibacter sphaeroides TaxID=1063 RepID=A0A2W5SCN9_CERSP|nr:MAG: FMN-binding glutamate synthase family protein [Cereibacter sphaeroides]